MPVDHYDHCSALPRGTETSLYGQLCSNRLGARFGFLCEEGRERAAQRLCRKNQRFLVLVLVFSVSDQCKRGMPTDCPNVTNHGSKSLIYRLRGKCGGRSR